MSINILENLLSMLRPLSIYHITETSYIMSELTTYEKGFAIPLAQLQKNIDDGFIQTCSSDGLKIFEGACGCNLSDLTIEERRQRLLYMISVLPSSFTETDILTALRSHGYDGDITIDQENELVIFGNVQFSSNPEGYKRLVSIAEKLLPSQLEYSFKVASYTWSEFDTLNRTFIQLDNLEFRWNVFTEG